MCIAMGVSLLQALVRVIFRSDDIYCVLEFITVSDTSVSVKLLPVMNLSYQQAYN